ncbi:glutathione reductase [Rodentibacter pneumotropicus]|uniref:Glutathione reductase n=1 Tax=Rodentibacter pneumotropicus TaxID=758 RepID=A0A448MKC6_9PAST|nr:glutathione reductase [Rodentibacter pneumotropicus]
MTKHYDYIAIGGGSGGIASINRAASYGKKCAIIEAKYLGGTCVNVGCVPKKVMFYGAQIAEAINHYAPDYGFNVDVKNLILRNSLKVVRRISAVFTLLTIMC